MGGPTGLPPRPFSPILLIRDLWMWGMTPPPAMVACSAAKGAASQQGLAGLHKGAGIDCFKEPNPTLMSVSSSSSPRIASCKWRGVIRFTCGPQGREHGSARAPMGKDTMHAVPRSANAPSSPWRRCQPAPAPRQSGTLHRRRALLISAKSRMLEGPSSCDAYPGWQRCTQQRWHPHDRLQSRGTAGVKKFFVSRRHTRQNQLLCVLPPSADGGYGPQGTADRRGWSGRWASSCQHPGQKHRPWHPPWCCSQAHTAC